MINEDGKLRFRKIARLMIPYYHTRLWKRRVIICLECGNRFMGFVKKETDVKLIFGHTHVPFVTKDNMLANSGSWLSNESTYSTYIEIKEGKTHLFQIYPDMTHITEIAEKFTRDAGN